MGQTAITKREKWILGFFGMKPIVVVTTIIFRPKEMNLPLLTIEMLTLLCVYGYVASRIIKNESYNGSTKAAWLLALLGSWPIVFPFYLINEEK